MYPIDFERIAANVAVQQFIRPVSIGPYSFPLLIHVAFFIACLPLIRLLLAQSLFHPIGRRFLPKTIENGVSGNKKTPKQSTGFSTLSEKWEMSCWSFSYYLIVTVVNFLVSSRHKWFYKPARLFYGCSSIPCEAIMPNGVLLIYSLQLGYYLQSIPTLIIWDLKRKDFYQMLLHHIATVGLMSYSLGTNFVPIGAMILLLHDVCDVFMEAAKLCRYLQWNQCSTVLFGSFVVVWIALRVVYFPFWLVRSAMRDTIGYLAIPYDITPQPHYEFLNGLLILLLCIHVYWTFLILRIVWSVLVLNKDVDDIREDEEEEETEKDKKSKKEN